MYMYIFIGFVIWLLALVALYFAPRLYVLFSENKEIAQRRVNFELKDLELEFRSGEISPFMFFGAASLLVIFFWPILLFLFGLFFFAFMLGFIPYLVLRRLTNQIVDNSAKEETW